jgi:hypothetical protein
VHDPIAQSPSGAWSSGGAILTFVLPMVLFIIVALGLYVLYTKPSIVPGRRIRGSDHPVSYTAVPGNPTVSPSVPAGGTTAAESTTAGANAKAVTEGGKRRRRWRR